MGDEEEEEVAAQEEDVEDENDGEVDSRGVSTLKKSGGNANKKSKSAKKKEKKKGGRKGGKSGEAAQEEDLEALLANIPVENETVESKAEEVRTKSLKEILKVSASGLDPEAEMQKLFGAQVVNRAGEERGGRVARLVGNNQGRRGGAGGGIRVRKKTVMMKAKESWPPVGNSDMDMVLKETRGGVSYFKFEWSREYVKAQQRFHECVETGDPNALAALLRTYPYHIDTLLQLHDAFQMTDEKDAALDLLERLIFRFENSLDSRFDPLRPDAASTISMPYEYPENRSVLLGILSYIQEIGKKGCSATSLEWSKLALSLDLSDPLGLLFLIDHYALRRREHSWLIRLYRSPLFEEHNLSLLPNFVFSIALSSFYLKRNLQEASASPSSMAQLGLTQDDFTDFADLDPERLLHNAFALHPSLFVHLAQRLATGLIKAKVDGATFNVLTDLPFFAHAAASTPTYMNILHHLYIERNHALWKDPVCIQWLKDCAISFFTLLTASPDSPLSQEWSSTIQSYETLVKDIETDDAMLNRIQRHVLLCESNAIVRMLPSHVLRAGFHIYAPGDIGAPNPRPLANEGVGAREAAGSTGQMARFLDYLLPFQPNNDQLQNILNLIGYPIGDPAAGGADQEDDEE